MLGLLNRENEGEMVEWRRKKDWERKEKEKGKEEREGTRGGWRLSKTGTRENRENEINWTTTIFFKIILIFS